MNFAFMDMLEDPAGFFMGLLISVPGILLAIILHEVSHGYVAYKLGDPTAKLMGRLTLNPARHLDPVGTLMLLIVGVGWAKPVPVNPNNFKKPRRDDFLVSIAGITVNIILFLLLSLVMYVVLFIVLNLLPADQWYRGSNVLSGQNSMEYLTLNDVMSLPHAMYIFLIEPHHGQIASTLYQMLSSAAIINLCLAIFNLIPAPPLDGYHVVNDLIFKGRLFASRNMQIVGTLIIVVLLMTGVLSDIFNGAVSGIYGLFGNAFSALYTRMFL